MRRGIVFVALGALCGVPPSVAAEADGEAGMPLIRSYSDRLPAWGADSQSFDVALDSRGSLYLANGAGVVSFDGAGSVVVPVGQRLMCSTVSADSRGHVAVGGSNDFGLLEADALGTPRFVSLLGRLPEAPADFGQTLTIEPTSDGFAFLTTERLYLWNGGTLTEAVVAPAGHPFPAIFRVEQEVYYWDRVRGLGRVVFDPASGGGQVQPIAGGDAFVGRRIDGLLGASDGRLLISVRGEGFYLWRDGQVEPFAPAASAWAKRSRVFRSTRLADGGWAFGSILGGLLLLSPDGNTERVIDTDAGLEDNFVSGVAPDREGGLWVTLNSGLVRVEIASPLSVHDVRSGLSGAVLAIGRHQGDLWVGTSSGLYHASARPDRPLQFQPVPGFDVGAWSLLSIGDELLVGEPFGASVLRGGVRREVISANEETVYALERSKRDANRVWVGFGSGLGALVRASSSNAGSIAGSTAGWRYQGKARGLSAEARTIIERTGETGATVLWAGLGPDGHARIELGSDPSSGGLKDARVDRFPGPPATDTGLFEISGEIYATRHNRILRLDERNGSLAPEPRFPELADEPDWLLEDAAGDVWTNTTPPSVAIRRGDSWPDLSSVVVMDSPELYSRLAEADGVVWAGGDRGLFRHAGSARLPARPLPQPLLGRVILDGRDLLFGGDPGSEPPTAELAPQVRRLRVHLAPLAFRRGVRYQTRLDPFDEAWGPWSDESHVDFTQLSAGHYTLEARTGGPSGEVSSPVRWSFVVLPPWYRTPWAVALWVALALAAVRAYGELRSRATRQRAERLEQRVAEQTAELAAANRQLLELSTHDDLTGLANRRLFMQRLEEEWSRARRQELPLALLVADLDHFKRLNDSLGHLAGDASLRRVGQRLQEGLRRSIELVARTGGEEFAMLLPGLSVTEAARVAEELRVAVEALGIAADASGMRRLTASFGVIAGVPSGELSPDGWLELADRALYRAKHEGRNRVVVA